MKMDKEDWVRVACWIGVGAAVLTGFYGALKLANHLDRADGHDDAPTPTPKEVVDSCCRRYGAERHEHERRARMSKGSRKK